MEIVGPLGLDDIFLPPSHALSSAEMGVRDKPRYLVITSSVVRYLGAECISGIGDLFAAKIWLKFDDAPWFSMDRNHRFWLR
jgi:hypothetical protein